MSERIFTICPHHHTCSNGCGCKEPHEVLPEDRCGGPCNNAPGGEGSLGFDCRDATDIEIASARLRGLI